MGTLDPVVVLAPGARRRPEQGSSADETKYDGRNVKETFRSLQRMACAALVLVALALAAGDGLLIRAKLRARRAGPGGTTVVAGDSNAGPGRLRHGGGQALFVDQGDEEQAPLGGEEEPLVAAGDEDAAAAEDGGAARPESAADLAAAWAADDAGAHGGKGSGGDDGGGADPALADLAAAVQQEAAAAHQALSAEQQRAAGVKDDDATAAAAAAAARRATAAGKGGAGGGAGAGGLNEMADPSPSWELNTATSTCAGYFGNGYTTLNTLVPGSSASGADAATAAPPRLSCRTHPATNAVYCPASHMVLHPDRITMSRGGEELDAVMGRDEDAELPAFADGAVEFFTGDVAALAAHDAAEGGGAAEAGEVTTVTTVPLTAADPSVGGFLSSLERVDPYKARMLRKARVLSPAAPGAAGAEAAPACHAVVTEPVVFVTRVEYANLFHTSTDWWNVWQTARIAGYAPTTDYAPEALRGLTPDAARAEAAAPRHVTPRLPVHVVFVDGHNASPMDDGWAGLVLSFNYAKHFEGPTCFTNVLFAPYGYHAAISQGMGTRGGECGGEAHVRQFGHDFTRALGLTPRAAATCGTAPETNVVFVRRVHYRAHPRHNGRIVRRLDNEDEIFGALEKSAAAAAADGSSSGGLRVLNGLFSSMTVTEQVAMVQEGCLLVGAHGAGLSHVLFAPDGVHMLELQPPEFQRPHFIAYTHWAGGVHHLWALESAHPQVDAVVARIRETAKAAGASQG